jgi:glutathione S-transferase
MKLLGDLVSPFVRMCMVTAHEVGWGNRVTLTDVRVNPASENADLARHSPIAKIPVLITEHNHALYDSRVIIEYICHISGNRTFIPDDGVKRFRVLTLLALAQGIAETGVAFRYETVMRPADLQWKDYAARLERRATAGFDDLEASWSKELSEVSAGSIAAAVALSYLDYRLPFWRWREGRPKLAAFHESFNRRPSMEATALPKSA